MFYLKGKLQKHKDIQFWLVFYLNEVAENKHGRTRAFPELVVTHWNTTKSRQIGTAHGQNALDGERSLTNLDEWLIQKYKHYTTD